MFLQVSVILLTGGGCPPQCMLGYYPQSRLSPAAHPLEADTPRADTPWEQTPPWSRHPPGSRHPLEQTPPGADTPQEQTPPGSRHPLDQTPPRSDTACAEHAGRYGQCTGGTHPTGMQSSYYHTFAFALAQCERALSRFFVLTFPVCR